ncbi:MAG: hypothetical protein ACP5PA_04445 [Elusimicrobiales bacterium]
MEDIRKTKFYPIFGFMGYIVGAINIYLFFLLTTTGRFSWLFYFVFSLLIVLVNLLISSLTYMYIDIQRKNLSSGRDIFLFYGESLYVSLFLLPLAYLKILGFITIAQLILTFFFIIISIWLYRVISIKKTFQIGFMNATIAAFFPHMFFMAVIFVLVFFLILAVYVFL